IVLVPVLALGLAMRFWVRQGLSDWLNWLLEPEKVFVAMQAGGRSVLFVTAIAAVGAIGLASLMVMVLTQPLLRLREVAEQVAKGDLDKRAPVMANDEIGQVAKAFNRMLDRLVRSQRQLERINQRLSALYHVTASVGRGLQLDHVLRAALDSTLEVTGLHRGWIYLRDEDANRFYLTTAAEPPSTVLQWPTGREFASCDCQQRLMDSNGDPHPSIHECGRLQEICIKLGTEPRHVSVPLVARGKNLGIMNLLWDKGREPHTKEMELLRAIGVQISAAVANARLHEDLQREEAGRRALMASLATAQEDERARISSELHDGTGQELTSLLLRLKLLENMGSDEKLRGKVEELCTDLSGSIERLRELSHELRPPDLEQLGLGPSLRNLAEDMFDGQGIHCAVECALHNEIAPEEVQISFYRIAQEALTNIIKHAGAEAVLISCEREEHWARLRIVDNGVGFDPDEVMNDGRSHLGLASIQERAERLGGSLVVETAPGAGTNLKVEIPLVQEVLV
ncbi:MAG: HAMP domain-containing protein, partial [Anaerolineales bacterium]